MKKKEETVKNRHLKVLSNSMLRHAGPQHPAPRCFRWLLPPVCSAVVHNGSMVIWTELMPHTKPILHGCCRRAIPSGLHMGEWAVCVRCHSRVLLDAYCLAGEFVRSVCVGDECLSHKLPCCFMQVKSQNQLRHRPRTLPTVS